ncbi:hypothetical protein PV721_08680 [Streptomyces sp. MB09-01]|uniref:hypothetical protein n=1 Tax=Streptomyces sp. MB09-01 TaxID=3028666 RepID=UPI0029BA8648|nr:hypothetical protein [Streptomyces sp. MB09-01]MDX3534441.1 hypothetical protein [Streptomyces sp. MB09-01]
MSSNDSVNGTGSPSAAVTRTSSVLTVWWATSPIAMLVSARFGVWAHDHGFFRGPAAVLVWVALTGVVVAPPAGLVLAYAGGHRRVRRRFAVMSAVSLVVCFLVFLFFQFATECRPGEPSCSP